MVFQLAEDVLAVVLELVDLAAVVFAAVVFAAVVFELVVLAAVVFAASVFELVVLVAAVFAAVVFESIVLTAAPFVFVVLAVVFALDDALFEVSTFLVATFVVDDWLAWLELLPHALNIAILKIDAVINKVNFFFMLYLLFFKIFTITTYHTLLTCLHYIFLKNPLWFFHKSKKILPVEYSRMDFSLQNMQVPFSENKLGTSLNLYNMGVKNVAISRPSSKIKISGLSYDIKS